jgi:hypothetical protein
VFLAWQHPGVLREQHRHSLGHALIPGASTTVLQLILPLKSKKSGVRSGFDKPIIEGPMTDDLVETAHQDYIEVASKQTGGKVQYFLCPHCRASFDALRNALTALDECVAHVRTCGAAD